MMAHICDLCCCARSVCLLRCEGYLPTPRTPHYLTHLATTHAHKPHTHLPTHTHILAHTPHTYVHTYLHTYPHTHSHVHLRTLHPTTPPHLHYMHHSTVYLLILLHFLLLSSLISTPIPFTKKIIRWQPTLSW